ncbi:MAG: S8 family serine peptidase, partial [Dongiaceae bacterium]
MRLAQRPMMATMAAVTVLATAWLWLADARPAVADGSSSSGSPPSLPLLPPGGLPGGGSGPSPPLPPGGGSGSGCCGGGGSAVGDSGTGGGGGNFVDPPTVSLPTPGIPGQPATDQTSVPAVIPSQVVATFPGTAPRQIGDEFAADHDSIVIDYFRLARLNVPVFLLAVDESDQFQRVLQEMSQDPRPLWVQLNLAFATSQSSTASIAPRGGGVAQYALDRLRVAPVLDITRGAGVKIAIVDSGVAVAHEALAGAHISIIDVISKANTLVTGPTPEVHGTAIAGIIVGHDKLRGVSPEVELLAIRAFRQTDPSSGAARSSSFHLSKGISTATDQAVRVINLSLTGPQDRLVTQAVEQALMSQIAVVAAAGNAGPGAPPAYPAAQPGVIAVTATDSQDRLYRYANRGSYITLAAPGVDILVAQPGGYGYLSGTSMATAYVSALSALMIARADDLTPSRLRKLLEATTTDLGAPQR